MTLLVWAVTTDQPVQAQTTCDRYVLGIDTSDSGDCSDMHHPCHTIQYAIDQSVDGDVICVAWHSLAGALTYPEHLVITRSITLNGAWEGMCGNSNNWTCSFTPRPCDPISVTIDGFNQGRAVTILGPVTPTIDCFTITGGNAGGVAFPTGQENHGGGIYSQDAAPIIVNNVITTNYGCVSSSCSPSYGRGGGIYLLNAPATAVISGNLIVDNQADKDSTWGQGGGIMLVNSDAQVLHNTIQSNRAGTSAGNGGGIMVDGGAPTIVDNNLALNRSGVAVVCTGGGIHIESDESVVIERNILQYNVALQGTGDPGLVSVGGGLYYYGAVDAAPVIRDNIVYQNLAAIDSEGAGGGMYLSHLGPAAQVTGNQFEWNIAGHNARGNGGGIYVAESTLTIDDNDFLHNSATWAGNRGEGGGIYVDGGTVVLEGNTMSHNFGAGFGGFPSTAIGCGGAVAIFDSSSTIRYNEITQNGGTNGVNYGLGGGIYLEGGTSQILFNTINDNYASDTANSFGGGIAVTDTVALIQGNEISGNWAAADSSWGTGGGIAAESSTLEIVGNTISHNQAALLDYGYGGGIYAFSSDVWLDANTIIDNYAARGAHGYGGGVHLTACSTFTLTNNIIAENGATLLGSGVGLHSGAGALIHNTIAANLTGDGSGVYVDKSSVTMQNNIVVSQTVGITGTASATVAADHTLFENNATDYSGVGVSSVDEVAGPAALRADYTLQEWSNAIGHAVSVAWLTWDIEGDHRPIGSAADIGADEYALKVYLPLLLRNG